MGVEKLREGKERSQRDLMQNLYEPERKVKNKRSKIRFLVLFCSVFMKDKRQDRKQKLKSK